MSLSTCAPGRFSWRATTALPSCSSRSRENLKKAGPNTARSLCSVSSEASRHRPGLSRPYQRLRLRLRCPDAVTTYMYTACTPRFSTLTADRDSINASHISQRGVTPGLPISPRTGFPALLAIQRPPRPKRPFSTSTMVAAKLDGTAVAKRIRERLREEIAERQKTNPRFQPCLRIIQGVLQCAMPPSIRWSVSCMLTWYSVLVGKREDSCKLSYMPGPVVPVRLTDTATYVRMKKKAADEVSPPRRTVATTVRVHVLCLHCRRPSIVNCSVSMRISPRPSC